MKILFVRADRKGDGNMQKINRRKIAQYFKKSKAGRIAIIAFILGGSSLAIPPAVPVGVVLIIIGLVTPFVFGPKRPSDKQMDAWLDIDLEDASKHALKKLSLHEDDLVAESVYVIGPRFWDIGDSRIGFRKGKDKVIRYTPVGITIIFFTQHQLVGYQCALDLLTGHPLNEGSDEYFYKDVVSVTTKTESVTIHLTKGDVKTFKKASLDKLVENDMLHFKMAEKFVLTTSGGTALQVVLRDPNLAELVGGGTLPTDRADAAIRSVRKMLREKKVA